MTRGPGGYGRYDADPMAVGCPWARSDMTPCVARDGNICLTDEDAGPQVCVGCGHTPSYLVMELAHDYPPAHVVKNDWLSPDDRADALRKLVWEATEPVREPPG